MSTTKIATPLLPTMIFLWLGHVLLDTMIGIWPVYKTIAHLDLAIAGLIGGLCAFAGEGMQIVFGSLSDKGYRKALILGGLIASTASACLVYVNNYGGLFALYLLTCMGSGAFHPSCISLVSDLPSNKKSLLVGIYTSGGAFGMAFSQIIFMQTYSWFDGHSAWLILPAVFLAALAYFSSIDRSTPAIKDSKKGTPHINFKAFGDFFRQKDLRMLYISQVCCATMLWGTMFLLPDLLSGRGYSTWISFGGGHLMFILGGACMMIPAGYLADRFSSRIVLLIAISLSTVLFYLFICMPGLNSISTLSLLFCLGATIGVTNPVTVAFGTRLAPTKKGLVSAFLMGLVWCVAEGLGQGGGGFLATCFTNEAPAKALAILGVLFIIGLGATYKLPQKEETEATAVDYA